MKKGILILVIALMVLLAGCAKFEEWFLGEDEYQDNDNETVETTLSDFNNVSQDSPEYVVKSLNDGDVVTMLSALISTGMAIEAREVEQPQSEYLEQVIALLNQALSTINANQEGYSILSEISELGESIRERPDRYDIKITLEGQARETMLENLSQLLNEDLSGNTELVIDYRDLAVMIYGVEAIIDFKERSEELITILEETDDYIGQTETPFKPGFLTIVEAVDWETLLSQNTESTWGELQSIWNQICAVTSPESKMRLNDVFLDEILTLPDIDFAIEYMNLFLAFAYDLYGFEEQKTDENGWTSYNSVYQIVAEGGYAEKSETIALFKPVLNKTLAELTSEPAMMLTKREISQDIQITLNGTTITENTKLLVILETLAPDFLNDEIDFEMDYNAVIPIEGQTDLGLNVDVDLTVLLTELSGLETSETNFAADKTLFDVLIDNEIWTIINNPAILNSTLFMSLLQGAGNNIDFFDVDSNSSMSVNYEAGDNNTFDINLDLDNYTFWDVIEMYLNPVPPE